MTGTAVAQQHPPRPQPRSTGQQPMITSSFRQSGQQRILTPPPKLGGGIPGL